MDADEMVNRFQPLAGYALVRLEGLYKDAGGIIIPEEAKTARAVVGRVWKVEQTDEQFERLGMWIGIGQRVIVSHYLARPLVGDYWIYPLTWNGADSRLETGIVALLGDEIDASPFIQELPRCQWCGPAREGTAQSTLLVDGVCPRCHKDNQGRLHDPEQLAPSTQEDENRLLHEIHDHQESLRRFDAAQARRR